MTISHVEHEERCKLVWIGDLLCINLKADSFISHGCYLGYGCGGCECVFHFSVVIVYSAN